MSDKLRVQEASGLLEYLRTHLRDWSRNKIKERLQTNCVTVNGKIVTKHDYMLSAGDVIEVAAAPKNPSALPTQLEVLYADHDLIAINKPAGLLSVGTEKETKLHALAILRHQMSRGTRAAVRLWPVHRIDRDTSGVLLFATSKEVREAVMATWETVEKIYLAVVEGIPVPPNGTIDQPLRVDEVFCQVHVGAHHPGAKPAITHYKTIRSIGGRSLLQVQIETGRQHQIRAHLGWLGYPVVGDPRYGTADDRMGLHAYRLKIKKPGTGNELIFETPAPADFLALLKSPPGKLPK